MGRSISPLLVNEFGIDYGHIYTYTYTCGELVNALTSRQDPVFAAGGAPSYVEQ
jgi:hypothetical protein